MKLMSRLLTGLMLSTAVLVCAPGEVLAQSYPNKPINIITPFPPGGAGDIVSRIVGQKLTENWGQPVVVYNRAGGNTVIGTGIAAKAPADGYNLFLGQSANMSIVPALYKHGSSKVLPYDTMKDFTPVAFVGVGPLILGVHPSVPVKSVKELVALAKSNRANSITTLPPAAAPPIWPWNYSRTWQGSTSCTSLIRAAAPRSLPS